MNDEIKAFETVSSTVAEVSIAATGRRADWRGEQISLAFGKLGMTCLTLLRLIPGSSYYTPAGQFLLWDLSSVASQCRNLIEAYHLLCYLIQEPASREERIFQQVLWEYHKEFERCEMLRVGLPDSKRIPEVAGELALRRHRLEQTAVFQTLSSAYQTELLNGRSFKRESGVELSRKAGVSDLYYRSEYKYCSAFTHSAPFSISQLAVFRANTPEAVRLLRRLVGLATGYAALAIRDFVRRFPDQQTSLTDDVREIIGHWEEIMKWEKLPGFKNAQ